MISLAAIRIEKRAVWRVDGLTSILAGSSGNHCPPSTIFGPTIQTLIADKRGSDFSNSPSPSVCVYMDPEMRYSYSRLGLKRGSSGESMDLAANLAGPPRNHGRPSTVFRTHRPDPNHGYAWVRFDQFPPFQTVCVYMAPGLRYAYSRLGLESGSFGESVD